MKRARSVWLLLGLFLVTLMLPLEGATTFKVIVHRDNPVPSVSRSQLSQYFLGTQPKWDGGAFVMVVDQRAGATVREEFSKEVHNKSVSAIKNYWQRQIFSGRGTPPPEKGSDQEVLDYVRANRDAIGYVSSGARLGDGVKEVAITE